MERGSRASETCARPPGAGGPASLPYGKQAGRACRRPGPEQETKHYCPAAPRTALPLPLTSTSQLSSRFWRPTPSGSSGWPPLTPNLHRWRKRWQAVGGRRGEAGLSSQHVPGAWGQHPRQAMQHGDLCASGQGPGQPSPAPATGPAACSYAAPASQPNSGLPGCAAPPGEQTLFGR